MKLRIPGNANTAYGTVQFVDGVSVRGVSPREANHIRAIIAGVEVLCDDGETVDEALNALPVILPRGFYEDAHMPIPSVNLPYWDGSMPKSAETEAETEAETIEVVTEQPVAGVTKFSRADLEAIASEKGIVGLREIAEPFGIAGRSIAVLIDALMKIAGDDTAVIAEAQLEAATPVAEVVTKQPAAEEVRE